MAVANKKKKIFDGRYEVLSIVGRGACSVVYHARHASGSASEVALKVLLNQKGGTPNTDRLRKEALAMVSSRHKYVVRLDDFHSVQDLCYLSMEYAHEGDLRKYTAKHGSKLSIEQATLFYQQCCEALSFIHRVGITHRDLKPDNILVINDKEIRMADFGVAVLPGEHASLEDLRAGVGTMSYMAPEVLEGRGCDKLSDIYSLAVTFYEILSGKHPFDKVPLIKQLEVREDKNITPIASLAPGLNPVVANAIMRSLRYDPAERFQSSMDLVKSLAEITKPAQETPAPHTAPAAASSTQLVGAPTPVKDAAPAVVNDKASSEQDDESIEDIFNFDDDVPAEEPLDEVEQTNATETSAAQDQEKNSGDALEEDELSQQPNQVSENENTSKATSYLTSNNSRPATKPSFTKPSSSLINKIIFLGIAIYAFNFILQKVFFSSETAQTTSNTAHENVLIQAVNEEVLNFPFLPAGTYSGEISGVIPGQSAPFAVISLPNRNALAIIVGIEGWTPSLVTLPTEQNAAGLTKIRVASNGMVLDMAGQVSNGEIMGKFKNAVSGVSGDWHLKAVK